MKKYWNCIKKKGVTYQVLVPNLVGYERLKKYKFDEFSIVVSASNTHNRKNINLSINEALKAYAGLAHQSVREGKPFRAYVSCAFGCPYEGKISIDDVVSLSKKLIQMGAYEISISDTIGIATPIHIKQLISKLLLHVPKEKIALHMHDTRNLALTNIYVAMQMGISIFDTSFGGLGGCPYAFGAAGNVATEDLVAMLYNLNIKTSINLDKLCKASLYAQKILNKKLSSKILAMYNK